MTRTKKPPAIARCPFCAATAAFVRVAETDIWFIRCDRLGCGAEGSRGSREHALTAWNRRAMSPGLSVIAGHIPAPVETEP